MTIEQGEHTPDLSWDEAMGLAATDRDVLLERLKSAARSEVTDTGRIIQPPSLWPTKRKPIQVARLRWQWSVCHEHTGEVLASGRTWSQRIAWTRTDRAAVRIRDQRAAELRADS